MPSIGPARGLKEKNTRKHLHVAAAGDSEYCAIICSLSGGNSWKTREIPKGGDRNQNSRFVARSNEGKYEEVEVRLR